ncbi:MAG: ABC transporter ATP-binding protein/permease [Bifidobacteriaceae bacterium]|jgi:ATP-binding cassette subfamily B protein|nr:ABC transporter ATP-binding protein/permease [Bifidobacteriaceae bacterium]
MSKANDQGTRKRSPWLLELWRRIRPRERRHAVLALVAGISWSCVAVAVPYVAGLAIDRLKEGPTAASLAPVLAIIAALGGAKALALRFRRSLMFTSSARAAGSLRQGLYASLHREDAPVHDPDGPGEILGVLGDDTEYIEQFGVQVQVLANNLVWTGLIVGVMVTIDPLLALAVLAPLPLVLILSLRFLCALEPANRTLRQETVAATGTVADAMTGLGVIQGLGLGRVFRRRFGDITERIRQAGIRLARIRAFYTAAVEFVPTVSVAIGLFLGVARVQSGGISIGELTAFNSYIVMAVWPLRFTAGAVAGASRAKLALKRMRRLEGAPAAFSPRTAVPHSEPPSLELRDVTFAHPGGGPILDRARLRIAPGEVVALTGATGVGKTTVLRLIAGDLAPDSGAVLVGAAKIAELTPASRGDQVSFVAEHGFLFSRTLAENLRLAHPKAPESQLRTAASLAVLDTVVDELPDGFETHLGERGARLSGGQRQRAALARGILSPARVLVLDDVTSALDAETVAAFARLMKRVRSQRTVVMVTAEPRLLAAADRVLELADGRLHAVKPTRGGPR